MGKRLYQIGTPIPLGALRGVGLEPLRPEEQHPPHQHAVPDAEGKSELVLPVLLLDGRKTADVGPQRLEIVLADLGEGVERHGGIKEAAVGPNSGVEGLLEFIERPCPYPGFTIRGDVGRVHHAERRVHPQSAGIGLVTRRRMAGHTIGGTGEIAATRDHVGIGGLLCRGLARINRGQSKSGEQAGEQMSDIHSGSARRLVWHSKRLRPGDAGALVRFARTSDCRMRPSILCVFHMVMYMSGTLRQRARLREDNVDEQL